MESDEVGVREQAMIEGRHEARETLREDEALAESETLDEHEAFVEGETLREDEAFARLEELMGHLGTMEAEGARLARARQARNVRALREQAAVLEREYETYTEIRDEALRAARETAVAVAAVNGAATATVAAVNGAAAAAAAESAEGAASAEAQALGTARAYSELLAVRTAPLQRAQRAYQEALAQAGWNEGADLSSLALSDEDFEELERRVREFQKDYQATYEQCQAFETI